MGFYLQLFILKSCNIYGLVLDSFIYYFKKKKKLNNGVA